MRQCIDTHASGVMCAINSSVFFRVCACVCVACDVQSIICLAIESKQKLEGKKERSHAIEFYYSDKIVFFFSHILLISGVPIAVNILRTYHYSQGQSEIEK